MTNAVEHADLVVPHEGAIRRDQTIVVDGDTIRWIGPSAKAEIPAGAERIDGRRRFVMPGLADMHAHPESERDLLMLLAAGVTTIRNMVGLPRHLRWRGQIDRGEVLGPRLYTVGPLVDGKPTMRPGAIGVESEAEAEDAVARTLEPGYSAMKVYDHFSAAGYERIMHAAEGRVPVVGHIPFRVPLERVLALGQRSIEHGYGYIEALLPTDEPLRRADVDPTRARGLLAEGAIYRIKEDRLAELVAATKAAGTWNCLTLMIRRQHLESADDLLKRPAIAHESPITLERWRQFKLNYPFDVAYKKAELEFMHRLLRALHDAGAGVLLGTDTPVPFIGMGYGLHGELLEATRAGLSPAQAITVATAGAARYLGEDWWGTLAAGKRADLVMLDADPLADIRNVSRVVGVMSRGAWHLPAELLRHAAAAGQPELQPGDFDGRPDVRMRVEWQGWPLGDEAVSRARGSTRSVGRIISYKNEGLLAPQLGLYRSEVVTDDAGRVRRAELSSETVDGAERVVFERAEGGVLVTQDAPGSGSTRRTHEAGPDALLGRATTPLYLQLVDRAAPLALGATLDVDVLGPGFPPEYAVQMTRYRLERVEAEVGEGRRYRFEASRPNLLVTGRIVTDASGELARVEFDSRPSEAARVPLQAGRPIAPPVVARRVPQ